MRRDAQRDDGRHLHAIHVVLARQNAMEVGRHVMSALIWNSSARTADVPPAHRWRRRLRTKSEKVPHAKSSEGLFLNNFRSVPDLKSRLDSMESALRSVLAGMTSNRRDEDQGVSPTSWHGQQGNSESSAVLDAVMDASTTPLSFNATRQTYASANPSREVTNPQEDTVDGMGLVTFAHEDASIFFGLFNVHPAVAPGAISYLSLGPTSNSAFLRHIKQAILGYSSTLPPNRQGRPGVVNISDVSRPLSPRLQPHWRSDSDFSSRSPRNAYDLPPRWKINGLVNAFFARPGMLFPYIYKKWILCGLEHAQEAPLRSVRRSWLCLLNTIMAFSTILGDSSRDSIETSFTEAEAFLQRALQLLPDLAVETANFETC